MQKLFNKIACIGLGISVSLEDSKIDENVEAYVSNNVSLFDHLAVSYAIGSVSVSIIFCGNRIIGVLTYLFQPINKNVFEKVLQIGTYKFGNTGNIENFKKNLSQFLTEKKKPLHFTPEEKPTNGRALLKFKTYPFEITTKIQLICINIERPIIDIATSTLGSNYFSDVFYFMFCPFTNYKLRFQASLEKKSFSSNEFAEIARQNLASALKVSYHLLS